MNFSIRGLEINDRPGLNKLLAAIPSFDKEDRAVALELIDIALGNPLQLDYLFRIVIGEQDQVIGYACYGPTPLTEGSYDLYWIAVDHALSGNGIGTALLRSIEEDLEGKGGRMLIIETSSSPAYEKTRHFYVKNGYPIVETIEDFYRDGEHRVTFVKRLPPKINKGGLANQQ